MGAVESLAQWLVRQGVDGVFVNGTTGESHSLTAVERMQLAERWVEVLRGSSLRCIIHVGSNCLREGRELAAHAQRIGASGIAALAPSYFKPADVGTWVECAAFVAGGAPGLPFHAYDLPAELIGRVWGGKFRGQTQKWFAIRFEGDDREIDIYPRDHDPEFEAWRWAPIDEVLGLIVPFKRDVYTAVLAEFRELAKPA